MKIKSIALLLIAFGIATLLSSCLPLAVGGAVGYVAHKEGYRVNSPVHRR